MDCVSFLFFRNGEKKESNNAAEPTEQTHIILQHVSYIVHVIWKKLHLGVAIHHVPSWVLANYY